MKKEAKKPESKKVEAKKIVAKKVETKKKEVKRPPTTNKGAEEAKARGSVEGVSRDRNSQPVKQTKDNVEMDDIANYYKRVLTRKPEDKVKEKEEFKKMETEQRSVVFGASIFGRKEQCVQTLGKETFEKVYGYLRRAKMENIPPRKVKDELSKFSGNDKDKMNAIFLIDQMAELDCMSLHP